jgi:hypothetical protein
VTSYVSIDPESHLYNNQNCMIFNVTYYV